MKQEKSGSGHSVAAKRLAVAIACALPLTSAFAFDINTGNPDLTVRWDNTLKYSNAWRVHGRDDNLVVGANGDDGDRNFDTGPVSNRLDLLTELDVGWQDRFGVRASAAGWYDSVYDETNANDSPLTVNHFSSAFNEFPDKTAEIMGRKIELLDAFGWTNFNFGDMAGTLRVGRHTLQYGETLFFGGNGIADAQGPTDIVKLANVPSSQFKEILRPVGQASFDLTINPQWSVGGYYQFEWDQTRFLPPGSYLSSADFVSFGDAAENLLAAPVNLGPTLSPAYFSHDVRDASSQGQGGFKVRWSPEGSDLLYGFYGAIYHAKAPELYAVLNGNAGGNLGFLREVFPEDIKTFGFSVTGSKGQLNWAAEVSWRFDAPLESNVATVLPGVVADASDHPLYAIGNTMHANLNGIYVMQPTRFWEGGALLAEVAWNYLMDCTDNCKPAVSNGFNSTGALDPDSTDHAVAFRMIFDPSYFQVIPGLDIDIPIGLGYSPYGHSAAVPAFNQRVAHGGDFSVGINGKYQQVWNIGLNYVQFIGAGGETVDSANHFTWDQTLKDRSFISFNIRRTF